MAASSSLRRQFDLLHRAASFRLLFFATLASGIGTWLAAIALTINVYDLTGSASWVSGLLIADFLPTVAIGLFFGSLVDRLQRKRLMIGADLVRLAVFAVRGLECATAGIELLFPACGRRVRAAVRRGDENGAQGRETQLVAGGGGAPGESVNTSYPVSVTRTVCSHCADRL